MGDILGTAPAGGGGDVGGGGDGGQAPDSGTKAQTPAPGSEPTKWMALDDEQRSAAPESVQAVLESKKWGSMEDVINSYIELEKFKGGDNALIIPEGDDADLSEIYNKLGRPEDYNAYEITNETGVELSDELTGNFKEFAHNLGLNQKQFNDVVNFQLEAVKAQQAEYAEWEKSEVATNMAKLTEKYGDEKAVQEQVSKARAIADKLGIYETIQAKGLGSDAEVIGMLATIASKVSEDTITKQTPKVTEKTPQEEIKDIQGSKAFTDKFDKDHKKVMARFMELNQAIAREKRG